MIEIKKHNFRDEKNSLEIFFKYILSIVHFFFKDWEGAPNLGAKVVAELK
jgi:hypothetical protein